MPRTTGGFAGRYWQGSASQATPVRRQDSCIGNSCPAPRDLDTLCPRHTSQLGPRRQHARGRILSAGETHKSRSFGRARDSQSLSLFVLGCLSGLTASDFARARVLGCAVWEVTYNSAPPSTTHLTEQPVFKFLSTWSGFSQPPKSSLWALRGISNPAVRQDPGGWGWGLPRILRSVPAPLSSAKATLASTSTFWLAKRKRRG